MKTTVIAALMLSASSYSAAATIHLKCTLTDHKTSASSQSWIAIDAEANHMRVAGNALPLSLTNEYYSSKTPVVSGFYTVHRIDRTTGEMVSTTVYGGKPVLTSSGNCERSEPPPTKL